MPAPTYRSVRLEPWLSSACLDPVELMVDHEGLIATIGIEFIGKKRFRENCANRVVSPRGSEVTVPNRIVGCYTYSKGP